MTRYDSRLWLCGIAIALVTLGLCDARPALAQTNNSYPMLMSARPPAVQVGQSIETEITSRYTLFGAARVLIQGDGLVAEVVPPEKPPEVKPGQPKPNVNKIKVKFTAAADAVPGVRDFRIFTPQGVSTIGQIVITRDPVIVETGENNTVEKAQVSPFPATLCGTIEKGEDIDCFKFKLDVPSTVVFHCWAQRIENRIHDLQVHVDPIITVRTLNGGTVATSDNVYAGDPLLVHKFDQPGEYVLEIRDVRYKGNVDWVYAVEMNARPFAAQFFPVAVNPGVETTLSALGFNLPEDRTGKLTLPADTPPGLKWISPTIGGQPVGGEPVFVTPLPIVIEAAGDNNAFAMGQAVTLPAALNGQIESPGDLDCYTFEAKKGENLSFEVFARRTGSALDPVIRLLNDKGAALLEQDDFQDHRRTIPDARIDTWSCPADGKYTLEVRDLHGTGGVDYGYVVLAQPAKPMFELELDTDKTLLAPGLNSPLYVRVLRRNGFTGDVQLAVEGLPPGVTATPGKILSTGQDGCIILQAAPDAPSQVGHIRVTGTATHPQGEGQPPLTLQAEALTLQEIYMPGGGRWHYVVDLPHAVSVADPMDVRGVKLSTNTITLKPGESQTIDVEIVRAPDFKGNVTLDVLFQHLEQPYGNSLPKGVKLEGGKSKTLLGATENKGVITLTAAADAPPIEAQLVPVMAHVSVNFVMKLTFCGEPVRVTVLPK